jgi:hypothetical protein
MHVGKVVVITVKLLFRGALSPGLLGRLPGRRRLRLALSGGNDAMD